MPEITQKTIEEIEVEYAKWADFLNIGVGLLSFSLGISCLGTPNPEITALISLIFILIFMTYSMKHFPNKLRELRNRSLDGTDELLLIGIEAKYFGTKSLIKNFPIFLIGWLFLGGVLIYGTLVK